MSIFSKLASQVTVKEFINQERNDGSGSFPVVVIAGPVVGLSSDGSVKVTKKDNVRVPFFGFEMSEIKETFPPVGERIAGVKIEQYVLPEPREWENPETGEIMAVLYGYRMVPNDGSLSQAPQPDTKSAPSEATKREPAQVPPAKVPTEVGTDATQ